MDVPNSLSASKEGTWAFYTVKDRMPTIVVSVIDTLYKQNDRVMKQYGQKGADDLNESIGRLSKMRYEMMTNKPLSQITDDLPDASRWNDYLRNIARNILDPSWYSCSWLFVECFMYRQIVSSIHQSAVMEGFDPYKHLKDKSYKDSLPAIKRVMDHMNRVISKPPQTQEEKKSIFREFLELALWGNKCDLSLSATKDNAQITNPLAQIGKLHADILVDDYDNFWSYLLGIRKNKDDIVVDIILDNAGFELITDLCLAEVMLSFGLADKVVFHVKEYPWFVSDATLTDIKACFDMLKDSEFVLLESKAEDWRARWKDGTFSFEMSHYWTLPYEFSEFRALAPELYSRLAESDLLIFKGDLNYRKLLGDREWDFETPEFDTGLQNFNPAPILAVRTLKSDVAVGLKPGTVDKINGSDKRWLTNPTGRYGFLQFTDTRLPLDYHSTTSDAKRKVVINESLNTTTEQ